MKKYRIDFELAQSSNRMPTQTIIFTYEDNTKSMADAIRDFYQQYNPKDISSITVSGYMMGTKNKSRERFTVSNKCRLKEGI